MGCIGERAAQAIRERAKLNGTKITSECENLDVTRKTLSVWTRSITDPNAYFLQQMALAGYDVIYILTGEKHD